MTDFRGVLSDCGRLLALALIPALLSAWLHPKRPPFSWQPPAVEAVELAAVRQWTSPVLWVDARRAEAYHADHIPGAIPLNENEWERLLPAFLEAWKPGQRVIVYCDSQACDASQEVARRLHRELLLSDVFVLKGGWSAWQQRR